MSNLTDLLPAGAGGKQVNFVASGTIGNGVTVGLNSDGTVTAVSSEANPFSFGSAGEYTSDTASYITSTYDEASQKVVLAYMNNGASMQSVVGTVSGETITFGTPVQTAAVAINKKFIIYDSVNEKVVILYRDINNSNYGTGIVGTVSGTSISFGSAYIFESSNVQEITATNVGSGKFVVLYKDGGSYGISKVGTVSGTAITFSGYDSTTGGNYWSAGIAYDSVNDKVVVGYGTTSSVAYSKVGTVSGTTISYGSAATLASGQAFNVSGNYDSASGKIVFVYSIGGIRARVGTVSGTSISFGTENVTSYTNVIGISSVYDSNAGKIAVTFGDNANSLYATQMYGTVSGTGITFSSGTVIYSGAGTGANSDGVASAYDSTNKKVVASFADTTLTSGKSVVSSLPSSNNTDFIGISDAAISDTASGSVTIKGGISANVTGLTPNSTYYVQSDGSLSTTASDVLAGKALSSTSINLDYTS